MIQCCICEDWLHGRHLKTDALPENDNYSEMICQACVPKLPFLAHYPGLIVTVMKKEDVSCTVDKCVDVETQKVTKPQISNDLASNSPPNNNKVDSSEKKDNVDSRNADCKKAKCKTEIKDKAIFMVEKWREQLCQCTECKVVYESTETLFLIDLEDSVAYYEAQGNAHRQSVGVQREIDALSTLDRITQTEMMHEYNNLSSSLREYLKKFAQNGKVVKGEDINEFFSQLKANKKKKTEGGFQFFCK